MTGMRPWLGMGALIAACGGGAEAPAAPAVTTENRSAAPGRPAAEAPQGYAILEGVLKAPARLPAPYRVEINKDQTVCGEGARQVDRVELTAEGHLRDAVVFLDGPMAGHPPRSAAPLQLDQKGCRFRPHIMAAGQGASLRIHNGDPVAHNIHGYERVGRVRRNLFNFSQPRQGQQQETALTPRRGRLIELSCDIHEFMQGFIFVAENPYVTLVPSGRFVLRVPPGRHLLKALHPVLGEVARTVDLKADQTLRLELRFAPP